MTSSLISFAFEKCKKEKRPALLTYTVCGDPTKKVSFDILKKISKNVDIIELGMAFSTGELGAGLFCCTSTSPRQLRSKRSHNAKATHHRAALITASVPPAKARRILQQKKVAPAARHQNKA